MRALAFIHHHWPVICSVAAGLATGQLLKARRVRNVLLGLTAIAASWLADHLDTLAIWCCRKMGISRGEL